MNCPSCQHEPPEGSQFCNHCGAPLELRCPSCDNVVPPGSRFCNSCGEALSEPGVAESKRNPRDYTPKHLADKILQSKSALEGERKQVTVLFADVKGSMELAEQVDPEEWHSILDRFFQILADGVHRFEGTVNQYTGDGIMALFGAPIAHEDHAQRACYAALHLRQELRSYGEELRRSRGLNFSARMGLNSGEVVVGRIGDDLRMDYTAQGQVVNLAERIEQLAPPESAYLTENTASLVAGFFQLRDLQEFRLKGVTEPVRVYELQDVGPMRTRLDVSRARGFSQLVGRVDEMTTLELALNRSLEGDGQVVGVVGEAGVGKSRLCLEFVERCRARDIRVLEAHCPAHGKTVPLLLVLELFRNSFGITRQDRDQIAREKIAGRLLLLNLAPEDLLPLVFDFLGVPDPERPVPQMDPEARQRRLFSFVRRMVQARSEREPAVVLLDDIQWMDAASDVFLAQLVEATSHTRRVVLLNFWRYFDAVWMVRSYCQWLPLSPLGREAIDELLGQLLGDDPTVIDLRDLIRERTAGNPFFIEELVGSFAESGALEGAHGSYRLLQPAAVLKIPPTVQAVLAARIDRLGDTEKKVLQTAAVIGKKFPEPVLAEVTELPGAALAAALAVLKRAEFIYEEALYPVAEYIFKHPLTQEVALESQLQSRRRRIHAAVARAIEVTHPQQQSEQAAVIAHHLDQAGEELEAARWHSLAAEWIGRSDVAQATRHWQRVFALTADLPENELRNGLRLSACTNVLTQGGWRLGLSREEMETLFVEGRQLAERAGDNDACVLLIVGYAGRVGMAGDVRRMDELCREAHALVDESTSRATHGGVLMLRSYGAGRLARFDEALRLAEEMQEVLAGDLRLGLDIVGFSLLAWSWYARAEQSARCGRLDDARTYQREAERLSRAGDVGEALAWVRQNPVLIGTVAGEQSERVLQDLHVSAFEGLELAEQFGSSFSHVWGHMRLAGAQILRREWDEAVSACERALQIADEQQTGVELESEIFYQLAEAQLGAGDPRAAQAAAEHGLCHARERGHLHFEALNHLARARALRHARGADASDEAERSLDRALELVEETNGRSIEPLILEERGRLAGLLGATAALERGLRDAWRLYTEMGATGHAERLARELGL